MVRIITILACVAICFQSKGNGDPIFNKITTDQGLSHNTVYAITQDNRGFLWFGTREGLNRYDGKRIKTFYAAANDSSSLISNYITALQSDHSNLLIGTIEGLDSYSWVDNEFREIKFEGKSLGRINSIFISSDSSIYICSESGLLVRREGNDQLELLLDKVNVSDILEYRKGVFWVSASHRLFMINQFGELIKEYKTLNNNNELPHPLNNISFLYKDKSGRVWLASKQYGIFKYDENGDVFNPVLKQHQFNPLEVNTVRSISEDSSGRLWIGTETGLFIFDPDTNVFKRYTQSFDPSANTLNDKAIYTIYRSRENVMWLGTYFGGVNSVSSRASGFKVLKADGGKYALSGKAVSDLIEDDEGRLWIATEDGGVNIWNRKTNTFSYLRNKPGKEGLSVDNVHALYKEDQQVWMGTFLGGVNRYDLTDSSTEVYKSNPKSATALLNNMVYAIHKDAEGTLWIGTQAGLSTFDYENNDYVPFHPKVFQGKFIYEIYEDHHKGLWICVMNSDSLYYYQPEKKRLLKYSYTNGKDLQSNLGVISALEDSDGLMWFGTIDRGLVLFDREQNTFRSYGIGKGLPNNYVYGILEDRNGWLWLSTNKGISKFNPRSGDVINYDISYGLPNNQFNFKSAYKSDNGWMYFGSINGLCYFHPDSLNENHITPTVYLSDLKLFNRSLSLDDGILHKDINATEKVTFRHNENVITLDFAAINYSASGNTKYAFYLDGFEKDWNFVTDRLNATYTNLSAGSYTFKVKASNEGVWSPDIKELKIEILPPFWLTKWAFVLYAMLIAGLFWLYRAFLIYLNERKMAVQLERLEREKITEINKHKLNFFTYISHEFKTPLTLIMASIDKFLQNGSVNNEESSGFWLIKRNAKRLHFLIDQLMEFRKVETDHASINYVKGDITLFLKDTFYTFEPLFLQKHISYHFDANVEAYVTYFDSDKLEKIATNLLSNAAKYTSENGEVSISVIIGEDSLRMNISDSGAGIDPEEIEDIFTSFYQTDSGKNTANSSGIGLALVKSLVEFLKGQITIQSTVYSGTIVNVCLPLTNNLEAEVSFIEGNKSLDLSHALLLNQNQSDTPLENIPSADYTLLIVEDNDEIGNFFQEHFRSRFRMVRACNGNEALDKLGTIFPDIIISDVMMPEMDGITLCDKIKSDINTSHIPVILLTAKTTIENRLEGLDVGADVYLSKPFALAELELHIKNLLDSRNSIKNHFLTYGSVEEVDVTMNNRDQEFLLKLTKIVEENLGEPSFNIPEFTRQVGVSRSLLHLKLKKMASLSASEFIRTIRLKKAAELLKSTDLTVSEVAYSVGYADANYFSRSFKERYRINPTEFKHSSGSLH